MRYEIPGGSDRISSEYTELLARLDRLTALLDSQFRIPWTPIRFGWDAIVGLVPVLGDLAMMIASLYLVTLANGYSFAARGSGTEPKMKFYLFAQEAVKSAAELPVAKAKAKSTLDALKALIEADARRRAER